ncbi:unnamed protein product [Timema podura]|uniref:V-type proton ATPase subunit n=1 Tax=Timema podura TaxID=61482 RepID=A0ABN7NZ24_TIMPD|nr:unnamed protein product [Timema podura]
MGAAVVPIVVFTAFWGVVGIVLPFVVPKGPNRGIFQVVLMLTAATCWLLRNLYTINNRETDFVDTSINTIG